jgi:hypothetical protein
MTYLFILIPLFLLFLVRLFRYLRWRQVIGLFKDGSCIVCGMRGSGKDMLFSNVCAYRNKSYCSNMDYTSMNKNAPVRYPFNPVYMKLGGNTFVNFADDKLIPYDYPLPDGCDYYISDAGVYFPCQENTELNKRYPEVPLFQALLRHLGNANFHCNIQNINRLWDKIREQADVYIRCVSCKVDKRGIVTQKLVIYDRYQSCVDRLEPLKLRKPLLGKQVKNDNTITKEKFRAQYGNIRSVTVRYKNRSSYDSRRFKTMLLDGSSKSLTLEGSDEKVS